MRNLNLLIVLVGLFALLSVNVEAKKFDKCSLAKALLAQGFNKADLRNWVCLVQNESGMDTNKKNNNRNGSTDWGLFQINDRYWCDPQDKKKKTSNECKIKCSGKYKFFETLSWNSCLLIIEWFMHF